MEAVYPYSRARFLISNYMRARNNYIPGRCLPDLTYHSCSNFSVRNWSISLSSAIRSSPPSYHASASSSYLSGPPRLGTSGTPSSWETWPGVGHSWGLACHLMYVRRVCFATQDVWSARCPVIYDTYSLITGPGEPSYAYCCLSLSKAPLIFLFIK